LNTTVHTIFTRRKRDLAGSRVLLTGVAGNLGRELAFALVRRGCDVLGIDRDQEALRLLTAEFDEHGLAHYLHVLDISDSQALRDYLARQAGQPLDILILNAGITRIRPFSEADFADFQSVMAVNFFAPVLLVKECLDRLRQCRGTIVGICSFSGLAPLMNRTAYSASKHALSGFLESLRSEEEAMDILVVYPSFLKTGIKEVGA